MKIRSGYVSNSSSSSYIIWGKNAFDFCNSIEDGKRMSDDAVSDFAWYEIVRPYSCCGDDPLPIFVDDDKWINKFYNKILRRGEIPHSIARSLSFLDLKQYHGVFVEWFKEHFKHVSFYEIEFSDHEGETKYMEQDMGDIMADYPDKEYICVNNH